MWDWLLNQETTEQEIGVLVLIAGSILYVLYAGIRELCLLIKRKIR